MTILDLGSNPASLLILLILINVTYCGSVSLQLSTCSTSIRLFRGFQPVQSARGGGSQDLFLLADSTVSFQLLKLGCSAGELVVHGALNSRVGDRTLMVESASVQGKV